MGRATGTARQLAAARNTNPRLAIQVEFGYSRVDISPLTMDEIESAYRTHGCVRPGLSFRLHV
jgi:hypothetical protein